MSDPDFIQRIRALDKPTTAQYANFAEYVATAHSWYKRLDPINGETFVVLLNPYGQSYMELSPRNPRSWNGTAEYMEKFGHLDYVCMIDGQPGLLGAELEKRFSFKMYPWVMRSWSLILQRWERELIVLRRGTVHPEGEAMHDSVLLLVECAAHFAALHGGAYHGFWPGWSDEERTERLDEVRTLANETEDKLVAMEKAKIIHALSELREWLETPQS